ncbi:unnamed protein product [Caenorhabditis auriculariae]|uniref:Uncharacterized protein n=1 Tax=Caenorhabditis auriculariae TaxID=2777116 RepID=A0A8S1GWC0_9PELO|nr:unnamed protein product [Caenorhabditis auriculariae]
MIFVIQRQTLSQPQGDADFLAIVRTISLFAEFFACAIDMFVNALVAFLLVRRKERTPSSYLITTIVLMSWFRCTCNLLLQSSAPAPTSKRPISEEATLDAIFSLYIEYFITVHQHIGFFFLALVHFGGIFWKNLHRFLLHSQYSILLAPTFVIVSTAITYCSMTYSRIHRVYLNGIGYLDMVIYPGFHFNFFAILNSLFFPTIMMFTVVYLKNRWEPNSAFKFVTKREQIARKRVPKILISAVLFGTFNSSVTFVSSHFAIVDRYLVNIPVFNLLQCGPELVFAVFITREIAANKGAVLPLSKASTSIRLGN